MSSVRRPVISGRSDHFTSTASVDSTAHGRDERHVASQSDHPEGLTVSHSRCHTIRAVPMVRGYRCHTYRRRPYPSRPSDSDCILYTNGYNDDETAAIFGDSLKRIREFPTDAREDVGLTKVRP